MKFLLSYIFLLFALRSAYSQAAIGIFISGDDLKTNRYIPQGVSKSKIRIYEIPYKSYVHVKLNDTTLVFQKDSIFGFIDKNGIVGRFFKKSIYTVINPKESILLYRRTVNSGNAKDFRTSTAYYFSVNADSEILPLNLINVLNAFKNDETFKDLIETHFRSTDDLLTYDTMHSQFKINHLFDLSKKQTHEK